MRVFQDRVVVSLKLLSQTSLVKTGFVIMSAASTDEQLLSNTAVNITYRWGSSMMAVSSPGIEANVSVTVKSRFKAPVAGPITTSVASFPGPGINIQIGCSNVTGEVARKWQGSCRMYVDEGPRFGSLFQVGSLPRQLFKLYSHIYGCRGLNLASFSHEPSLENYDRQQITAAQSYYYLFFCFPPKVVSIFPSSEGGLDHPLRLPPSRLLIAGCWREKWRRQA